MEFFNVGLLVAVATPVAVVVVMNVMLALAGEQGTLLLPTVRDYPTVLDPQSLVVATPEVAAKPAVRVVRPAAVVGYDEADELVARQAA